MKFKYRAGVCSYSARYLTPSIRFGLHKSGAGGFIGITFLKFDAVVSWSKNGD